MFRNFKAGERAVVLWESELWGFTTVPISALPEQYRDVADDVAAGVQAVSPTCTRVGRDDWIEQLNEREQFNGRQLGRN